MGLFAHTSLGLTCFERLDLLLITCPQSGHWKGFDSFF